MFDSCRGHLPDAANRSGVAALAALAAVAIVLAGCGSSAAPPLTTTAPKPPHRHVPGAEQVGVMFNCLQASPHDRAVVFSDLGAAAVDWVRIDVSWAELEPAQGTYSADYLGLLDRCVAQAVAHRMQVLIVFLATPRWASSGGTQATPPTHPWTYARALRFLAGRYRGDVGAWEIWNEENTRSFWRGTPGEYVRLLQASYRAVKRSAPGALVVFGGTNGTHTLWLRQSYAAGAKGYFDVMAAHPYGSGIGVAASPALGGARSIHREMLAHGDRKPIWFTEFGWSAPWDLSARRQAVALTNALDYTARSLPYVTNVFWFEAKNEVPGITPKSFQGGFSLISPSLKRRPAFDALAAWIRSRSG